MRLLYIILLNILFFSLVSLQANTLPVIDVIGNKEVNEDSSLDVAFKISDAETSSNDLEVEITSSDQSILPDSSISTSGTGSSRSMSLVPSLNQNGPTTIAVKVTDKDKGVTTETFQLNVISVNDSPTISFIEDQFFYQGESFLEIQIFINDVDGDMMEVNGVTDNQEWISDEGIVDQTKTGNSRFIRLRPVNLSGDQVITITVSDELGASSFTNFKLKTI